MFIALERNLNILSQIIMLKSKRQYTIYKNELYGLKYSFLKGTVKKVTCVTPCKAKKNFQTSHFVANGLFCNFIYLVGSYNYFCSNSHRFNSFLFYYTFCRGNEYNRLLLGNAPIARWLTCCKILEG